MGNRTLRKQLVNAMKEAGISGKLYYGNKHQAWRYYSAQTMRDLIYILSIKPGTVVFNCDCFNHRVKCQIMERDHWYGTALVLKLDRVEFEDGSFSCGCPGGPIPAWTREQIEKYWMLTDKQIEKQKLYGWWSNKYQAMSDTLRCGEHICDEDGILLPRFKDIE